MARRGLALEHIRRRARAPCMTAGHAGTDRRARPEVQMVGWRLVAGPGRSCACRYNISWPRGSNTPHWPHRTGVVLAQSKRRSEPGRFLTATGGWPVKVRLSAQKRVAADHSNHDYLIFELRTSPPAMHASTASSAPRARRLGDGAPCARASAGGCHAMTAGCVGVGLLVGLKANAACAANDSFIPRRDAWCEPQVGSNAHPALWRWPAARATFCAKPMQPERLQRGRLRV